MALFHIGSRIMTLTARWIDLLYRVATGSRRIRNVFTPIGAIFFGLLLFLFIATALKVDQLFGLVNLFQDRRGMIPSDDTIQIHEPLTQNKMILSDWLSATRDTLLKLSLLISKELDIQLQ